MPIKGSLGYSLTSFLLIYLELLRYCKRAKALFKELNQVPHVVELDERGILKKFSLLFVFLVLLIILVELVRF